MSSRKRMQFGVTLACFVGIVFTGLLSLSRYKRIDLQLNFVGYTNVPIEVSPLRRAWMIRAIFEVTNCGSVPVRIAPIWEAYQRSQISAHVQSYLLMPTSVLNPGKAELATMLVPVKEEHWQVEVAYTRLGLTERLTDKARNARSVIIRTMANGLSSSAKLLRTQSDWITNSHWPAPFSRYHINAPLPDITIELTPGPPRR